jgi:hypothetical protein
MMGLTNNAYHSTMGWDEQVAIGDRLLPERGVER